MAKLAPDQERRMPFSCKLNRASIDWLTLQAQHLDVAPGRVVELLIRMAPRPPPVRMMDVATPAALAQAQAQARGT